MRRQTEEAAMTNRYARGRSVTSTCARGAVMAAVVCAVTGDPPCGNPWFRVGDFVRSVVGNLRIDHGERAREVRDSVPQNDAMPDDRDAGRDDAGQLPEP